MNTNHLIKYNLAIFDLDGTIFDTIADIYDSLAIVFIKNGILPPSADEAQMFMGDGLRAFLQKAAQVHGAECTETVINDFISHYSAHCTKKTVYYPEVQALFDVLHKNDVKLALLSNKSESLVVKILEDFGIQNYFIYVAGGDTFSEKKPSPLPILAILEKTGFSATDAVMIGDSENDIAAGYAAGVKTCLCRYGYGLKFETSPDYEVKCASEIQQIFIKTNNDGSN